MFRLALLIIIADVFTAVQSQETTFGVVPFENSSNGSVVQTLDLFSDRDGLLRDIYVCGEIYVDIEHCLLGYESKTKSNLVPSPDCATPTEESPTPQVPRSRPLTGIDHIKHIFSHPQAFGQSYTFINTYLHNAEIHEVSSTSKGAELVAEHHDVTMAAIASEAAAEVFDLKVLARSIQDLGDNTTRFFVIKRGSDNELVDDRHQADNVPSRNDEASEWKSLVGFTIDHRKAGALADALNVFKLYGLNLNSINSRPSHRRPWHYMFLIEFEGKIENSESAGADQALGDLRQLTQELRWYGSWRNKR